MSALTVQGRFRVQRQRSQSSEYRFQNSENGDGEPACAPRFRFYLNSEICIVNSVIFAAPQELLLVHPHELAVAIQPDGIRDAITIGIDPLLHQLSAAVVPARVLRTSVAVTILVAHRRGRVAEPTAHIVGAASPRK